MTEPVHLLARAGDLRTLCGRDVRLREGWPFVLAAFLPMHTEGRAAVACVECVAAAADGPPSN